MSNGDDMVRNATGLTPAVSSSQEVPLSSWAQSPDGLARLKPNGIHWAAVAVQPHHQLYRMDNVCVQYAESKAVLIALANTFLNGSCYIFTVSGNVASDLVVWSAT